MKKEGKIFVTSDTHFFHNNIREYCNRPYKNIDEMTEGLIKNWNSVVEPDDVVYHLGDVAMGGVGRAKQLESILWRLNGRIRLLRGNHDSYVLKTDCVERFEWVRNYYELKHNGRFFVLQHYPLFSWNKAGKSAKNTQKPYSMMIHGHCHGNIDHINVDTTRLDAGVDSQNYTPISLEQIIEVMDSRQYRWVDHHGQD